LIGVDTNVLLRLFVADHPGQHKAAKAFFAERSETSPAFVCTIVLLEFIWSLRRTYGYTESRIHDLMSGLLAAKDIEMEQKPVLEQALQLAEKTGAGLADTLIVLINRASNCTSTVTFDKAAARQLDGMELLS
jgi:predicted nucleic-acid-binding protein